MQPNLHPDDRTRYAVGKIGGSRSSSADEAREQPAAAYLPAHGDTFSKEVPHFGP